MKPETIQQSAAASGPERVDADSTGRGYAVPPAGAPFTAPKRRYAEKVGNPRDPEITKERLNAVRAQIAIDGFWSDRAVARIFETDVITIQRMSRTRHHLAKIKRQAEAEFEAALSDVIVREALAGNRLAATQLLANRFHWANPGQKAASGSKVPQKKIDGLLAELERDAE